MDKYSKSTRKMVIYRGIFRKLIELFKFSEMKI